MRSTQKAGSIEKAAHRLLAAVRAVQELVRVSRPAPDDPEGFDDTLMSIALFGKRLEGALELSGEDRAGAVEASLAALATWGEALAEQIEATDFSPPDETDFEVTILELEAATEAARMALGAPPETEGMPARAQAIAWEVLAERQRQIGHEGFDQRHDAGHGPGVLSRAAACYAIGGTSACPPPGWPWDARWWKPGPRRRDLIKSAALLLAEIERMDRETEAPGQGRGGIVNAAEDPRPLARPNLAQRVLRRILSRLAGFTPGVFYYSRDLRAKINDTTLKISLGQPGSPSSLNSAMLALCCALDTELTDVGDRMECEITGAENRGKDAGCWHVVITRLPDSGKEGR